MTGGTAGAGTLIDAAIEAAGGRNAASEAGYRTANNTGQRHSAFRRLVDTHASIEVPGALWSCAGPGLIEAAEQIADALDALVGEGEG